MFESIQILTFVPVAIRPCKHPKPFNKPILPLPIVLPVIDIRENTISMKVAIWELALENAWTAHIMPEPRLDSMKEVAFIVGAILKLFLTLAMGHVILPLAIILIPLIRIVINTTSVGLIILDLAFIHTPVVITVPAFTMGDSLQKGAHVIGAVLKKELALAVELIILPLTMVVAPGSFDLLVTVSVDPVGVNLLPELVLIELLDLFAHHWS